MGLFFDQQQHKFHFYLHLYGRHPAKTHKAVVMIMAKDGAIVQNPHLEINGKKVEGNLIELNASVRTIDTNVDGFKSHFAISWDDIVNRGRFVPKEQGFTPRELGAAQKIKETSFIAGREIFLLPNSFRMVAEFNVPGYIYCLQDGNPCSDTSLNLDGKDYPLKKGVAEVVFRMPPSTMAVISFPDGDVGAVAYPFKGRMFFWDDTKELLTLQTLIPVRRVVIDCYKAGEWLFSDGVSCEGALTLPTRYELCDRIQASFDSGTPGTSFAVFTENTSENTIVVDPYYNSFIEKLPLFEKKHTQIFSRIYQRAFFLPLAHLYDGRTQEKLFNEKQRGTIKVIWGGIALILIFGILFFNFSVFRKIRVVEGEDGELLTHSFSKQVMALAASTLLLSLFAFGLLYLLKHMA